MAMAARTRTQTRAVAGSEKRVLDPPASDVRRAATLNSQNAFVTGPHSFAQFGAQEYETYKELAASDKLYKRLHDWPNRESLLKETSAEAAFIRVFFEDTWGYCQSGQQEKAGGFTLWPKFTIPGAGAKGGAGEADLAVGYFGTGPAIPQVLCEFKDITSSLDAEQKRKGNTRSPVRQCLDYLSHARKGMIGSEPVLPMWVSLPI